MLSVVCGNVPLGRWRRGGKQWYVWAAYQVGEPGCGKVRIQTRLHDRWCMIIDGTPNAATHRVTNARATVSVVMSGREMASGQRVKRSMQVSVYVCPLDGGNGPTRSM